jgi:hypothetical protein
LSTGYNFQFGISNYGTVNINSVNIIIITASCHSIFTVHIIILSLIFRNLVRVTKSSQLQSVDPSQSNNFKYLGKQGKDFEFSHLGCKVEVAECSANTGDDDNPADMKSLEDWVSKL